MPTYGKLVRDRIPEIIRAKGGDCETRVLDEGEWLAALNAKLDEELAEYRSADESGALEELADLLEVVYAVALARGCSREALESIRAEKERTRGGFCGRIFLERTR